MSKVFGLNPSIYSLLVYITFTGNLMHMHKKFPITHGHTSRLIKRLYHVVISPIHLFQ